METEKLMIIDGNSILNRAFYGLQGAQMLATTYGLHTNAVYGFLTILNKFLEEEKPTYLCVAFDLRAPTFRHLEFEGYKAKRKGMPAELAEQLPVIKEVLDAMNIKRLELEGYEADDIIGSISLCAEAKDMDVIILTGDKDSLQLASEKTRIKMPITRGGRTDTDEYDHNKVIERFGVTPEQYIDVKGLMGDQSDNIPGVPGIGEKTAIELIIKFKSIEKIYENIDQVEKKGVKEKLLANRELAFISKRIATIERNMPHLCDIDELKREEFDFEKLYELFKRLEFKSLIEKFNLNRPIHDKPEKHSTYKVNCLNSIKEIKNIKTEIRMTGRLSVFPLIDREGSFDMKLAGIALAWDEECSEYIKLDDCVNEDEFIKEFEDVFTDPSIKIVGHDMKSFLVYLKRKGIDLKGLAFDTKIAAYIINPSSDDYNVSELLMGYLNTSIDNMEELSGKGKKFSMYRDISNDRLSEVAGCYCCSILKLSKVFSEIIKQNDQCELYYDIELPLVNVLADMEFWGFKVNIDGLRSFSEELDGKINLITCEIYNLAGETFNINSPKQLGVLLFEKLKLPVLKKTKTGYSTDAEVLEQLASMHEIVSKILEYRQLVKLKSTYAEGLLNLVNPSTGRIHSSFNQTVTTTGRISSTEPNLQNIPIKLQMGREIRKVFVPANEQYLLSDADYSQIELRVLAHITQDSNLIAAFRDNEDIHTATAAGVFGISKEDVTQLMRQRAKAVNFGIVYGIGDFSLAKDLGITRKEARQYIDEYLEKYPKVKEYMHDTIVYGKENGFVKTLFNRRRYLPELKSSNFNLRSFGERVAMNTPIQGSAADIIKIAMVKVYNHLKEQKMKSRLILQVHDELIIETFIDEREQAEKILKGCMEKAVNIDVPLYVEVKSGMSWYETK